MASIQARTLTDGSTTYRVLASATRADNAP